MGPSMTSEIVYNNYSKSEIGKLANILGKCSNEVSEIAKKIMNFTGLFLIKLYRFN